MEENTRPTSVTVIAWLLIGSGAIATVTTVMTIDKPEVVTLMKQSLLPLYAQYALLTAGLWLKMVSGGLMLKGADWGRRARGAYVTWSAFGLVIGFATVPDKVTLIPGVLFAAVVAFFLYRPKANVFFSPHLDHDAQHLQRLA